MLQNAVRPNPSGAADLETVIAELRRCVTTSTGAERNGFWRVLRRVLADRRDSAR